MFSEENPIQPLKSAGPLFKSGSGDHPYPSSQKFGNLTISPTLLTSYTADTPPPYQGPPQEPKRGTTHLSGDWYGEWRYDRRELRADLANGKASLDDGRHQGRFLDWMRDDSVVVFEDKVSKERVCSPVCRRGNRQYAMKKARQRDAFLEGIGRKVLDHPHGSNPNYRDTQVLLITVTFDKKRFTKEESWTHLSSTEIEGSDIKTGVLNDLTSNLRDIFGPLCKITVKEAQEDGYPAPHMIVFLDRPVTVKLHKGRYGQSWRIVDPRILRRIGKDPALRRLSRKNHVDAIRLNPIWKYGFIDIQGIVKEDRFRNRRDAVSYAYKYLTKSLVDDHGRELEQLDTISGCRTKSMRIALWGHLANKSFGLRDITYGKKVKEFLEMLPEESDEEEPQPTRWEFKRTMPRFVYEDMVIKRAKKMLRKFKIVEDPPPETPSTAS